MIINKETKVLVQGITGKEGSRATKEMIAYGTKVVAGVTPGKGGQEVENLPVFNTVKEAKEFDKEINATVLYVPPLFVKGAALEAIEAGIELIVIITENVPVQDTAKFVELAAKKNIRIIGPSSIGILQLGECRIGSIGGANEDRMYSKGNVAIVSKSGGMCSETSLLLTQQGIGQSTVVGIGGDVICGTSFTDMFALLEKDENTKVIVMYGEIGGKYEELAAQMIKNGDVTKPVVAFISGQFAQKLSREVAMGHAGAIIEKGSGSAQEKKKVLKESGALIANYHDEIPTLVKEALEKNGI
tara:strand:- start:3193 stop:4095 length:903 start_codon:yes stop_codon:yes gene_type:complete